MAIHATLDLPVDELQQFCQRHGIRRLAIFGSALRDDFGPDSDVDILVEFEPGTRVGLSFFTMEQELSDLLGRQVDLNTPGFLGKRLRDKVRQEVEVLYESSLFS